MTALVDTLALDDVVASNIRAEAARAGYSQSALARALGMSVSAAHHRLTGARPWQLAELDDVSRVLGVSVSVLIDRERLPRLDSN